MSLRNRWGAIFVVLLILAIPTIIWAGGWAVATLDELPTDVAAGRPFTIGFVIRHHGQEPAEGLNPTVTAVHTETGESVIVKAREEGKAGHYVAAITLPGAGVWRWTLNGFGFEQPMPNIDVQSASAAVQPATNRAPLTQVLAISAGASLAAAGGFLLFWRRTRTRLALALCLTTAVIGGVALLIAAQQPVATAVAQNAPTSISEPLSLVEQGAALFVAKGCVMCHLNERSITMHAPHIGPNLTYYKGDPTFLRSWLADPLALKPETYMPNLQLSEGEIEALIMFLTEETAVMP